MFIKRVAAVVGAGIVLAAAMPTFVDAAQQFQGVIVRNTEAEPVRTQEANRFSVHVRAHSDECRTVDLPAGRVVIEHVNGGFIIDTDAYLVVWSAARGGPDNSIGRTNTVIPLAVNEPTGTGAIETILGLETALVIEDGFVERVGTLFRDADNPVEVCGNDGVEDRSATGTIIVSGRVLE